MRPPFRAVAWASLCLLSPLAVHAETAKSAPTIDQSLNFLTPASPRISPDGRMAAYSVQKTNWEENAFETEIWLAQIAAPHNPFRLTTGKKSSTQPRWSPDSQRIAFLSDRDGKNQIYIINLSGGEARQATKFETAIADLRWSPDGKKIAFAAPDPEDKTRKDRKEKYGEFEVVRSDYVMNHLWSIDAEAPDAKPERLTEGAYSVGSFSWAPDGKRIAFDAAKNGTPGFSETSDIFIVSLDGNKVAPLVTWKGPDRNPTWSPDGSQIAFETSAEVQYHFYSNSRIAIVPAAGGTPKLIAKDFDEDPTIVAWTPAGIFFQGLDRSEAHLYLARPTDAAKFQRLSPQQQGVQSQFSLTPDGTHAVFVGAHWERFPEVYATGVKRFEAVRLTAFGEQVRNFSLAKRELVTWKSKDGATIDGVLLKPADFDPSKKYPLLVVIHGGPTGIDQPVIRPDRYYPAELFVQKGALVLRPNYRGSAGHGEAFRALNVRNLGVGDAWDVLSGVDALIAKGFVDPHRLGAMGWSQGGYISAFLTTSSDRFQAISVGAGISDWSTYYVNTDITPFTRQYLKATPWDDPEVYRVTSPISYLKTAKTPTLIQHGELDKRVPIPNAYELRQALEDRGVPVKMIVYKGFGHGIDKPKQQRAVMEHNLEWFGKYIWNEGN